MKRYCIQYVDDVILDDMAEYDDGKWVKYEDAAQAISQITAERDQLRTTNQELSTKNIALDEELGSLTRTAVIKWFLAGAGVLFLGWLIGKSSGKRRRGSF